MPHSEEPEDAPTGDGGAPPAPSIPTMAEPPAWADLGTDLSLAHAWVRAEQLSGLIWAAIFARLLRLRLLQAAPIALFAIFFPLVLVPLAVAIAAYVYLLRRYASRWAWALGRQAIFWRTGRFGEIFKAVPLEKIQVVVLAASPFDRRRGTATVLVDTAATDFSEPTLKLPYLPAGVAATLASRLASESGRRSFRW